MLHSQARVIVLIILPEMRLIKKKNTVFPEVHLQYLGGICTEFIGINQTNCFTQKLLTNLRVPRTLSICMMGLPLDVCISFSEAVVLFFHFTWNIHIYPSRSNTSLFSFCIVERKCWGTTGHMDTSVNRSLEANLSQWICGGTSLLQKVKMPIIFLQCHNYSHPRMRKRQCL